jgi:hypothetical protein
MTDNETAVERRRRLFCNCCNGETNHILRGEHHRTHIEDEIAGYWEKTYYRLWTCAGCDTGTMEEAWTSTLVVDEQGDHIYEYSYHPPRSASELRPKVFRQLPKPLKVIYAETIGAFNHKLYITCAGGLRALIEGICENKNITGRNLEERIDRLETVLPKNIVQSIHGFRFMGNEALHRLSAPEPGTLRLAIEVSEDLLNFLYELDYKASRLPKRGGSSNQQGGA